MTHSRNNVDVSITIQCQGVDEDGGEGGKVIGSEPFRTGLDEFFGNAFL